jgi:hypothetical protein
MCHYWEYVAFHVPNSQPLQMSVCKLYGSVESKFVRKCRSQADSRRGLFPRTASSKCPLSNFHLTMCERAVCRKKNLGQNVGSVFFLGIKFHGPIADFDTLNMAECCTNRECVTSNGPIVRRGVHYIMRQTYLRHASQTACH